MSAFKQQISELYNRPDRPKLSEIAAIVGTSKHNVAQIISRAGWNRKKSSVLTDRTKSMADAMRARGCTLKEIGEKIGISINTLHKYFTYGDPKPKPRVSRPCLCCGNKFVSEGPHNRMCPNCRHKS